MGGMCVISTPRFLQINLFSCFRLFVWLDVGEPETKNCTGSSWGSDQTVIILCESLFLLLDHIKLFSCQSNSQMDIGIHSVGILV